MQELPSQPDKSLPLIDPKDPAYVHLHYGPNAIGHFPTDKPVSPDKSIQFQNPRPEESTSIRRINKQPNLQKYYQTKVNHYEQ